MLRPKYSVLEELLCPVVGDSDLQLVLTLIQVVLQPFFELWLDGFEFVGFDLVLGGVDILLLHVILFGKAVEPDGVPGVAHIANHREGTCLDSSSTRVAFGPRGQDKIGTVQALVLREGDHRHTALIVAYLHRVLYSLRMSAMALA